MRALTRGRGLIHHSDQGSQYTSFAFGKRSQEMSVRKSMSSVGDAYRDDANTRNGGELLCEP